MHRFYANAQDVSGDKIIIDDRKQIHRLKNVLRLRIFDKIIVFDEQGNEYRSIIEKILPQSVTVKIEDKHKSQPNQKIKITLACAIPKKSKFDDIVDKLTQLGVDRIIPLETKRVIVKLDPKKKILRQKRWQKIALNASLQSQRNTSPIIEPIKSIKEVLFSSQEFDLKLIPTLSGQRRTLREILENAKPKNILVLIGPEGDFTSREVALAQEHGCIPLSLGDLVLRVETAAIAVVSFIRLYEKR